MAGRDHHSDHHRLVSQPKKYSKYLRSSYLCPSITYASDGSIMNLSSVPLTIWWGDWQCLKRNRSLSSQFNHHHDHCPNPCNLNARCLFQQKNDSQKSVGWFCGYDSTGRRSGARKTWRRYNKMHYENSANILFQQPSEFLLDWICNIQYGMRLQLRDLAHKTRQHPTLHTLR